MPATRHAANHLPSQMVLDYTPGNRKSSISPGDPWPDLGYGIIISSSTVIILNFPCRALTSLRVTSVAKLEMFKMTCKNATIPPTSQI
uniref:Uncharacterized protein n=1 Tax=Bionectria ochroleuca TaxID=29856 RepID=A0A0B7JRA8_BIOOC